MECYSTSRKNFKVTAQEDGKEYWISRAHAVVGCIIDEKNRILLERRGEGCPDHIGKLAYPCGYVDWGETRMNAIKREVFEELGLDLTDKEVIEWCTIDDPKADARENIVTRYVIYYPNLEKELDKVKEYINNSESRGGEAGEVSEILLLDPEEIFKLSNAEFAFSHRRLTLELFNELQLITVLDDPFYGRYSGGRYIAFYSHTVLPDYVLTDIEEFENEQFWERFKSDPDFPYFNSVVAVGNTKEEALNKL